METEVSLSRPNHRQFITKFLLFALTPICLILLTAFVYLLLKYPTTSPSNAVAFIYRASQIPHIRSDKEIVGFLPYWSLDNAKYTFHKLDFG